jgi:hypothetical protein
MPDSKDAFSNTLSIERSNAVLSTLLFNSITSPTEAIALEAPRINVALINKPMLVLYYLTHMHSPIWSRPGYPSPEE